MQTRTFSALRATAIQVATVTVRVGSKTGPLATGLLDEDGAPLDNPFPIPRDGRATFQAENNDYWVNLKGPGFDVWEPAQFLDVNDVLAVDIAKDAAEAAAVEAYESAQSAASAAVEKVNELRVELLSGEAGEGSDQIAFKLLSLNDAVVRTMYDRDSKIIRLNDGEGIDNTGSVPCSDAIEALFNQCSGYRVEIEPGTYLLDKTVVIDASNIAIFPIGKVVFKRMDNADVGEGGIKVLGGNTNVIIGGIELDGNRANQASSCSGLELTSDNGGVVGATINNVFSHDWGAPTNTDFAAGIHAYNATNLIVSGNRTSGNAHYGMTFFECTNIQIIFNNNQNNGRHNIGSAGLLNFIIAGNIGIDSGMQGIWTRNMEYGEIFGNIVGFTGPSTTERIGIQVKQSSIEPARNNLCRYVRVYGNIIYGCSDTSASPGVSKAIYQQADAANATQIEIYDNTDIDCDYGIYMPNGTYISVAGNKSVRPKNIGIYDGGSNHPKYHSNTVIDGVRQGMDLACRYGSIKMNRIQSTILPAQDTYDGIVYRTRTHNTISENEVSNIDGTNRFLSAVYLEGDFCAQNKVYLNSLKNTNAPVRKSATYGASGNGNADWSNFNSSAFAPYMANSYAGTIWMGDSQTTPTIRSGSGSPEGVVAARIGSLYLRTDGGAATTLYVKESGTGMTGWVAK